MGACSFTPRGRTGSSESIGPVVGKVAIVALLLTLLVLFALNGEVLLHHFDKLLLVSAPLLIGFAIVVGFNLVVTRMLRLRYREAIITTLIGSSSHFEIAIASAVAMYGVGSYAALGTTMGLFWEVPIMLGLVYLGRPRAAAGSGLRGSRRLLDLRTRLATFRSSWPGTFARLRGKIRR